MYLVLSEANYFMVTECSYAFAKGRDDG